MLPHVNRHARIGDKMQLYIRTTVSAGAPNPLKIVIVDDEGNVTIWQLQSLGLGAVCWQLPIRDGRSLKKTYGWAQKNVAEKIILNSNRQNPYYVDYQLQVDDTKIIRLQNELENHAIKLLPLNTTPSGETCSTIYMKLFMQAGIIKKIATGIQFLSSAVPIDVLSHPEIRTKIVDVQPHAKPDFIAYSQRTIATSTAVLYGWLAASIMQQFCQKVQGIKFEVLSIWNYLTMLTSLLSTCPSFLLREQPIVKLSKHAHALVGVMSLTALEQVYPFLLANIGQELFSYFGQKFSDGEQQTLHTLSDELFIGTGMSYFLFNFVRRWQFFAHEHEILNAPNTIRPH